MKEYNQTEQDFIVDLLKSEGFKLFKKEADEAITRLRKEATLPNIPLEERLWKSAEAQGYENCLNLLEIMKQ